MATKLTAEEFIETKELPFRPMEGYIIPYSRLVNLLNEFSNQDEKDN